MRLKSILIGLFSLGFIITTNAQETKKVLFVGNSYTYGNNLPSLLASLADANGDSLIHDSSTPGGHYFRLHSTNTTTINKINSQAWDYVILQEQSQIPSLTPAIVGNDWSPPHAEVLDSMIKANNSCTETVFFMTWGRKNGDASFCGTHPPVCTYEGMQLALRSTYLFMANENDATVAPVGMAWRAARQQNPSLNLYTADESHPNINGSYLAACVFYATLYRKPSTGISYYSTVDTTTAQFLQGVADQIVFDSLAIWRIGHQDLAADFTYSNSTDFDYQFTNTSMNATSYMWMIDGTTDTLENPTYTFSTPGTYSIELTAYNDCDTVTTTQQITVTSTSTYTEALENHKIKLYPNPSTGIFYLNFEKDQIKSIRIFNAFGQLVFEAYNFSENQMTIDLEEQGLYYLELLEKDNQRRGLKLLKK
jgi:hypothetical protein